MHRGLWLPRCRKKPFFPLCPCRTAGPTRPGNSARLPPSRHTAYAPSGITHTRSQHFASALQDFCSNSLHAAHFVVRAVYDTVVLGSHAAAIPDHAPLSFIAFAISSTAIAPSLPILQASPFNSTIVDGSVAPVSPASKTSGTREPSCFITCAALAHEENPEMFALVPVTGPSNSSISRRTTSLRGQRSATRPVPAVSFNGILCAALTTSVSPPGQNFCASRIKLPGVPRESVSA